MEKKSHNRSSSKLQSGPRTQRPGALQRRQHSYHSFYGHSGSRPTLGASKKVETEIVAQDEDETGMASFIQFCATCEKQIVTPGSNILYCSEACRRKDVSSTEAIDAIQSPAITPATASYFDVVPPRSPTLPRPLSLTFSDVAIPASASQYNQEAFRYFSQYHSEHPGRDQADRLRPRPNRSSTATESGIPSLVNTPSSSVGTAGSVPSYRPLPPKHDPLTASGHFPRKSTDLVIPTYPMTAPSSPTNSRDDDSTTSSVSTLTSARTPIAAEVSFHRRASSGRQSNAASGSLKQLLSHEAMRSAPGSHVD